MTMARRKAGNVLSPDGDIARAQILTAAQAVFVRFGLAKTTMDDIAKEAGVSRPTVYRYFQDRTELISALVEWRARELLADTKQFLVGQTSFEEALATGLIHVVTLARRDPIVTMVLGPGSNSGDWFNALDLAANFTAELWQPIFEQAQKRGEMRANLDLPELYTWLALVQVALLNRMEVVDENDPAHARMVRTFVLPAILTASPAVSGPKRRPANANGKRVRSAAAAK